MKLQVWKNAKFERYVFIILLAVEMIMSFTFLGYIHIPPISATTAFIPIVVAACLFTPMEAAVAGLCFGLGSMFKASALYVMPDDKLFSPFQSGDPVGSLWLSLGTRVLFGLLMGWLYRLAKAGRLKVLWKALLALAAPALHAFLVYGALRLLFPQQVPSYNAAFQLTATDIFLAVLCLVSVAACDFIYGSRSVAGYRNAVNSLESQYIWTPRMGAGLGALAVFIVCMAVCSTVYFSNRMKYMLTVQGIAVSENILHDILYLQTQFLFSVLCLCLILLLVILLVYRYMKYREYMGEVDALTEVMGRRLFLNYCAQCQKKPRDGAASGWFLFLDVDHFKEINDTWGHAAGDEVLKRFAGVLDGLFKEMGAVGRVGGDEFSAIIEKGLPREELERLLERFLTEIAGILPDRRVSSSIGACRFAFPMDVTELLTRTDRALYQAKENGRGRYVIWDEPAESR